MNIPPHPEVIPEQTERHAREPFAPHLGDEPLAFIQPYRECAVLSSDQEDTDLEAPLGKLRSRIRDRTHSGMRSHECTIETPVARMHKNFTADSARMGRRTSSNH